MEYVREGKGQLGVCDCVESVTAEGRYGHGGLLLQANSPLWLAKVPLGVFQPMYSQT